VFWLTGGWELTFAGVHITSHHASSLLIAFGCLALIRVALTLGVIGSVIVGASTALALGAGELLVRWLAPMPATHRLIEIHRPSEVYGWELNPGVSGHGLLGERIDINSAGLRDVEHAPESHGAFRIALVGDSFTFGMGVDLEDTYGKQLEQRLRSAGKPAEVASFGVVAYQLWQLVRVLQNKVAEFHPDLVVIAFFYDDLTQPSPPDGPLARNPFATTEPSEYTDSELLNLARNAYRAVSARFRYLNGAPYLRKIDERRGLIGPGSKYDLYYRAQAGLLDETTYASARRDFETISAWSKTNATPVLAVLIPDSSQLGHPDREAANRFFAAELARVGIPFHDLTPALERDPDPRTLYLFPVDAHTTPKANGLIADEIAADPTLQRLLAGR
jgi:hypothetical protein